MTQQHTTLKVNWTIRLRRSVWRLLRIYFLVVLVFMLLENFFLYPAPKYPSGYWMHDGVEVQDVNFTSEDKTPLHGWLFEHPEPRGYLLYCHGNAENVSHLTYLMQQLRDELEYTVFAFDYRGYGRSGGSPHEAGILADGDAAHRWLLHHSGSKPDAIVLMGRSLGGAVAVDLAERHGARGLILENTFTTMPDVAAQVVWWAPVRWLMRTRYASIDKIRGYSGPLLHSHGTNDEIVPLAMGRQLFEAAGSSNKEFLEDSGATHNDPRPPAYFLKLQSFVRDLDESHASSI